MSELSAEFFVVEAMRDSAKNLTNFASDPNVAGIALTEWRKLETRLANLRAKLSPVEKIEEGALV